MTLFQYKKKSSNFLNRRSKQAIEWFHAEIGEQLRERLEHNLSYIKLLGKAEESAAKGTIPGSIAARQIIDDVFAAGGFSF